MSYHKTILVGNLGHDPELKYMQSGDPIVSFPVAVNESYTKDGAKVEKVIWFNITVFGVQAESCNQYLKKGSKVLVDGRLKADDRGNPPTFTRKDGSPGSSFEIVANTVRFLSSKEEPPKQAEQERF